MWIGQIEVDSEWDKQFNNFLQIDLDVSEIAIKQ